LDVGNGVELTRRDKIGISMNVEASQPKEHSECFK
jgi:hypothetical protein